MRIDLTSLSFGSCLLSGGGSPSWGTALGQGDGHKYIAAGYDEILTGVSYCYIPTWCVAVAMGKGGALAFGFDTDAIQHAALFRHVYINGKRVNYPFIMLVTFDKSDSHYGRREFKYSRTTRLYGHVAHDGSIQYEAGDPDNPDANLLYNNASFFEEAERTLGITPGGCWFVYEMHVLNQDELRFDAVVVNPSGPETYDDSRSRRSAWESAITPPETFDASALYTDLANGVGLSYEPEFVARFCSALQAKPFVVLTGLSGSGKTKIAQAFVEWISRVVDIERYPFVKGGYVQGAQSRYQILDVDRLGAVFAQPGGGQTMIPFEIVEEWADYMAKTPSSAAIPSQQLANDIKTNYPTKYSGAIHSFHSLLKPMAQLLNKEGMESYEVATWCLVPVGADWTNSEKLLGYPNALDKQEYVMPDTGVLKLMMDAEKNPTLPFFLILDEMNLSHVERYFADFLSAMESGDEIKLYDGNQRYGDKEKTIAVPRRIRVPKNLFVIGTMNVDETTYMFSPKVLDRAQVIEFRVSKDEMGEFLANPTTPNLGAIAGKGAKYAESFLKLKDNPPALDEGESTTNKDAINAALTKFFEPLAGLGAEFGYRTAGEVIRFCRYYLAAGATIDDAIDAAIVQKLLPKLHGSLNRLGPVLDTLIGIVSKKEVVKDDEEKITPIYPLSYEKLTRMKGRLEANGFTSFAEA